MRIITKILRTDNHCVGAAIASCDDKKYYCQAAYNRSDNLKAVHNKVYFQTSITLDYGKVCVFYIRFRRYIRIFLCELQTITNESPWNASVTSQICHCDR